MHCILHRSVTESLNFRATLPKPSTRALFTLFLLLSSFNFDTIMKPPDTHLLAESLVHPVLCAACTLFRAPHCYTSLLPSHQNKPMLKAGLHQQQTLVLQKSIHYASRS